MDLPPSAAAMVLGAAVAHAAWNAIAHHIDDKVVGFALLGIGGGVPAIGLIVAAPMPKAESWPYLLASVVIHIAYTLLLMRSYQLGDFNQAYPLARGTSPLVVTVLAAIFVGEVPSPLVLTGVIVVSIGLGSLVFAGGPPGREDLPAVAAAIATGLAIATYSTIDGVGVRASGSAAGYTGWLLIAHSSLMITYAAMRRGPALLGLVRPHLGLGSLGGGLGVLAYGLVLWAQTRGALAPIAALRESSIIVGSLIGVMIFRERFGGARIVATIVVFSGIVLITA